MKNNTELKQRIAALVQYCYWKNVARIDALRYDPNIVTDRCDPEPIERAEEAQALITTRAVDACFAPGQLGVWARRTARRELRRLGVSHVTLWNDLYGSATIVADYGSSAYRWVRTERHHELYIGTE